MAEPLLQLGELGDGSDGSDSILEIHELKKVIRLFWVNFIKVSVLVISKFLSSFPSNVQKK